MTVPTTTAPPYAGAFGTTVADVQALIPSARLFPTRDELEASGLHGVTVSEVERWIDELSAVVALEVDGWRALTGLVTTPPLDGSTWATVTIDGAVRWVTPGTDAATLATAARTIVANGVASYVEAARYSESAAKATTSYQHVLWERYDLGLAKLAAWWARKLAKGVVVDPQVAATYSQPTGVFPPSLFPDDLYL